MYDISAGANPPTGNTLLPCLPAAAAERLRTHLHAVNLHQHQTLYDAGERIEHVYFPAGAVVTSSLLFDNGAAIETSMVGREGLVGINVALGAQRSDSLTRVLLPGCALRIRGDVLRDLFDGDEALRRLLLFYYQMRINHVSQRAVCHSRHRIQERLCTWLLMVHDRCDAERMPLTQESIARQLSVRRAGINECIGALHEAGLIEHTRASLKIINRDALERAACACYRTFAGEMSWHETFNGPRAA